MPITYVTSLIGTLEPIVAWVEEISNFKRWASAWLVCSSIFVVGLANVFSFNIWSNVYPLGFIERFSTSGFFDVLDYLTANIMMPLGGLLLAVFAGWRIPEMSLSQELRLANPFMFKICLWLLRLVAPLSILAIFWSNL